MFTVIAFWPRNAALWAVANGAPNAIRDRAANVRIVHEWVAYDWLRVTIGVVGVYLRYKGRGRRALRLGQARGRCDRRRGRGRGPTSRLFG
jgi:hypothetical protein